MDPVFVDFSTPQPRTGNAEVRTQKCSTADDHLVLDAGAAVEIDFELPGQGEALPEEVTLKIRALVSKLGPRAGHAPLAVTLNGGALLAGHRIPGGGDLPQELVLAIPRALLRPGTNTLQLAAAEDATSHLWLYGVLAEPVGDRDGAERAWAADAALESLLDYDTYRRAEGCAWEPGPALRVYLDSGECGLPAQLGWRDAEGVEASVSFAAELTGFYGQLRDEDGQWYELRGELTARRAFPADTDPDQVLRFATEAGVGRQLAPGPGADARPGRRWSAAGAGQLVGPARLLGLDRPRRGRRVVPRLVAARARGRGRLPGQRPGRAGGAGCECVPAGGPGGDRGDRRPDRRERGQTALLLAEQALIGGRAAR